MSQPLDKSREIWGCFCCTAWGWSSTGHPQLCYRWAPTALSTLALQAVPLQSQWAVIKHQPRYTLVQHPIWAMAQRAKATGAEHPWGAMLELFKEGPRTQGLLLVPCEFMETSPPKHPYGQNKEQRFIAWAECKNLCLTPPSPHHHHITAALHWVGLVPEKASLKPGNNRGINPIIPEEIRSAEQQTQQQFLIN